MGASALVFEVTNSRDVGKCRKKQTELDRSKSVQMEIFSSFCTCIQNFLGAT